MNTAAKNKYARKHAGESVDRTVAKEILARAKKDRLSCMEACRISEELHVSLAEVGRNADLLDLRLNQCRLGLFGYASSTGKKRIVKPAKAISDTTREAVFNAIEAGRLPCKQAWEIADRLLISKKEVAAAAEALGIKISHCQLGAF